MREETEFVTCGLIVSDVLQGLRQATSRTSIERHFREMDWLSPKEPDMYVEAADLFRRLRARGMTIRSTIGCVIANLAADHPTATTTRCTRAATSIIDALIAVSIEKPDDLVGQIFRRRASASQRRLTDKNGRPACVLQGLPRSVQNDALEYRLSARTALSKEEVQNVR